MLLLPFALQISAGSKETPGFSAPHLTLGEGPTWTHLPRPMTGTPVPHFDLWV